MRSIVYNGIDLSDACSAEVLERVALPVVPDAMMVPGRAGALLVAGRIPPGLVRVRLFMDAGFKADVNRMADMRHRVYSALCSTSGGTLRLPDEPELEYRDALCTDAGDWSSLFEDGQGEVEFTLFDPVAYGAERVEHTRTFEVDGSWPTWPTLRLEAKVAAGIVVVDMGQRRSISLDMEFSGGEMVVIDCEHETVDVDGTDARDAVTLDSDFFALSPGECNLVFFGCENPEIRFRERWL